MRQILLFSFLLVFCGLSAQTIDLPGLIQKYKEDVRGPYRDIRWFCPNGTTRAARDPCPDAEGVQHARYKDEVVQLGKTRHLFWGQILASTDKDDFWDAEKEHSRLKQYQLEQYLRAVDDGWVLEKARYYRGAMQVEDEEEWGRDFFRWLLRREDDVRTNFYLIRQAARDIPHRGDTDLSRNIRAVSRTIADEYPKFQDLRIKIHGRPEAGDAAAVREFLQEYNSDLIKRGLDDDMVRLAADIDQAYGGASLKNLQEVIGDIRADALLHDRLTTFLRSHGGGGDADRPDRLTAAADLLYDIRRELLNEPNATTRLNLLDVSLELETLLFREANDWEAVSPREQMEKICYLGRAAAGAGFLENWEFDQVGQAVADPNYRYIYQPTLTAYLDDARRLVEWGTATNRAVYGDVVDTYAEFEPLAVGFLDDRIRSSVLLPLGTAIGELGDFVAAQGNERNEVMDVENQGQIRGLNPGYARGKLVVVTTNPENLQVENDKIYAFLRPPSDIKPVAGILTVSEGNMVSHVQLLARNLGIPNAILTADQLEEMSEYDGEEVFYAVGVRGNVIMKPAGDMDKEEKQLFAKQERNENRIRVEADRIKLNEREVLNMRNVRSSDSGIRVGPKAANLGQLKALFPENVVEGLVIGFGIFRDHMDQLMPGPQGLTYWQFLNSRFAEAERMRKRKMTEDQIDEWLLRQLATLSNEIKRMPLKPYLKQELEQGFRTVLGGELGAVPVFLRSDTNMEDLKEFTGAGLNLTLFNVVDRQKIIDGIKEVWASPYTERSYRWRQRYLLNPENVFPSILIIPSVDVDYSGVVITKGVTTGNEDDVTAAFSRGAGGAVDGQAAESYLLDHTGRRHLLSPARERMHRRLPAAGGSVFERADFDQPILNRRNLDDLEKLAHTVESKMPEAEGVEGTGPWDVELGFQNDKIWLFQIRPFVENKRAQSSDYLERISPALATDRLIDLTPKLPREEY